MELQSAADLSRQEERAPDIPDSDIAFEHGDRRYEFGGFCAYEFEKETQNGAETVTVPFAREVWPVSLYRHVDDDDHGVRFIYRSTAGTLRRAEISQSAFTSASEARRLSAQLASRGVQVMTDKGKEFAFALGAWAESEDDPELIKITHQPGWHEGASVYVHGTDIVGPGTWYADTDSPKIQGRNERSGSVTKWTKKVDKLCTTHGLRCGIGAALAGFLVEICHPQNFMLHFYGGSSSGKSTLLEVATSVVGCPDGMIWHTWDTTVNAIEGYCEMSDGSVLVMDESTKWGDGAKDLSKAIYNIASQSGRGRMNTSGELQETKSWKLVGLSSGEISFEDQVGQHWKGGHRVRIHNIHVTDGDVTTSKEHADSLKQSFGAMGVGGCYGTPGVYWSDYLVNQTDRFEIESVRDQVAEHLDDLYDDNPETERILRNIVLVGTAMVLGHRVDEFEYGPPLIPWEPSESIEAARWLAQKATTGRRESTPQKRALELLWDKIDQEPAHYPTAEKIKDGQVNTTIWGIRGQSGAGQGARIKGHVFLSESHLKASGVPKQAGVGPREFLGWLVDNDHAEKESRRTVRGGIRRRWYKLKERNG